MKPKTPLFSLSLFCALLFFVGNATAQLAPAGSVFIKGSSGQNYYFTSEGTFLGAATFTYIDYGTGLLDSITPTVSANGSFNGFSEQTGRSLTGQISSASISLTYNGITVSAPKASSYGPTRSLAGEWVGFFFNPSVGIGFGEAIITSQGQIIVIASQQFGLDAGVGTITSDGQFSAQLLSGVSISGNGKPSFGGIFGDFALSNGQTDTAGLIRAVPSRLENISTRGFVGSGEQVLIAGFIIGDGGKTVLMDAKGPSLSGVANPVNATQISLFFNGQVIASNNGWRNNANVAEIAASGIAPTNDRESALQVSLEPGAYTVVVASGDSSTGIGLVEVYGVGDTQGP